MIFFLSFDPPLVPSWWRLNFQKKLEKRIHNVIIVLKYWCLSLSANKSNHAMLKFFSNSCELRTLKWCGVARFFSILSFRYFRHWLISAIGSPKVFKTRASSRILPNARVVLSSHGTRLYTFEKNWDDFLQIVHASWQLRTSTTLETASLWFAQWQSEKF